MKGTKIGLDPNLLTLIFLKWPEKVDRDWVRDCSSPISAKIESNQGICTDSEAKT